MTTYTFTEFKSRKTTASISRQYDCALSDSATATGIHTLLDAMRHEPLERFWSAGSYKAQHNGDDWQGSAALTIEYSADAASAVYASLNEMPWHYFLVDTKHDMGNGILVVLPLARPVTRNVTYTRLAALIAKRIGVVGARPGGDAITYLWTPTRGSAAVAPIERADEGDLLDADLYLASPLGKVWAVFSDWVGKGKTPLVLPFTESEEDDPLFVYR